MISGYLILLIVLLLVFGAGFWTQYLIDRRRRAWIGLGEREGWSADRTGEVVRRSGEFGREVSMSVKHHDAPPGFETARVEVAVAPGHEDRRPLRELATIPRGVDVRIESGKLVFSGPWNALGTRTKTVAATMDTALRLAEEVEKPGSGDSGDESRSDADLPAKP